MRRFANRNEAIIDSLSLYELSDIVYIHGTTLKYPMLTSSAADIVDSY